VDDYAAGFRRATWSVGEAHFVTDTRPVWQVDGRKGELVIVSRAKSQTAAWRQAVEQAAVVGMVR
jgi:hypothetical protein